MSVFRIASRYAKSLLDLAIEKNTLEEVRSDVQGLNAAISGSRELFLLLKSPIISSDKKKKCMDAIFSGKFNTITSSFYDIVIRKRRESVLPEMGEAFMDLYREHKKIGKAHLTTASTVSDDLVNKVKNIVLSNTKNESVDLETSIDKSLIGGFVLEFEDKRYDASIASKLEAIKQEFSTK